MFANIEIDLVASYASTIFISSYRICVTRHVMNDECCRPNESLSMPFAVLDKQHVQVVRPQLVDDEIICFVIDLH